MKLQWLPILSVFIASCVHQPLAARAENIFDPLPALTWDETLGSELIVAAHYENHQTGAARRTDGIAGNEGDKEQTLTLHVDRVLKGTTVHPGDSLNVSLRHWYTIETRLVGSYRMLTQPDGVPRLCYKVQLTNPGGLSPVQILSDIREDALYFFPKAAAPQLERVGQLHSTDLEAGWAKAIHGEPLDLPFQLAQNVDPNLRRETLEELDVSRDPATLDLLFEWLSRPNTSTTYFFRSGSFSSTALQTLMALGGHGGDVYNRAEKRLASMSAEWMPYSKMSAQQVSELRMNGIKEAQRAAFNTYGQIMAEVDGDRAAHDFTRMIKTGPPALVETAGNWLGYTYSETALNLAFQLLKSPKMAPIGATALRNLLRPTDSSARSPRDRQRQTARQQALALPRLPAALKLPAFDASRTDAALRDDAPNDLKWMRLNREALEEFLRPRQPPAPVDLDHAQQVLLHPGAKTFDFGSYGQGGHFIQGEGIQGIQAIQAIGAADPRFIPLLVEMLHSVSPGIQKGEVEGVLKTYVQLFPNAFKLEMQKQGLTPDFYNSSPLKGQGFEAHVLAILNNPTLVWTLDWPENFQLGGSGTSGKIAWIQRYAASPVLLDALRDEARNHIKNKNLIGAAQALRLLLILNPDVARPQLEQALQIRTGALQWTRAPLLAVAVANGHPELTDELLSIVSQSWQEESAQSTDKTAKGGVFQSQEVDLRVLLWAKQPVATALYLKILDEKIAGIKADFPHFEYGGPERMTPAELIQALFADHPADFFPCVSRLIHSPMLSQRAQGQRLLETTLFWNLGFEAEDFQRERNAKLQNIDLLLTRLGTLDEPSMRVLLLERLGVTLPKAEGKRLDFVLQQSSSPDLSIAQNASRLLALWIGDDSPAGLAGLSAPVKAAAFQRMLADRPDMKVSFKWPEF